MGDRELMKKRIVISAVNFTEGGPLSVLVDCLKAFKAIYKAQELEIIVYVHKIALVADYVNDFTIVEYPLIKSSWLKRLRFEFVESKKLADSLKPDLWIALHDITPNVKCKQVVYCHNPSPFYKMKGNELFTDTTFFLFCLFYKFLYKINIKKNRYVIVQQEWLRKEFESRYKVKTIVAYPFTQTNGIITSVSENYNKQPKYRFIYPAFPRVAKNFEVLLRAAKKLSQHRTDFEILLTISEFDNKYAQQLSKKYGNIGVVKLIGRKNRDEIFDLYDQVDCMVFPSKLETWGLPISEFKTFNKPMLLADLNYAHEALGEFNKAKFFDCTNDNELAEYMSLLIDNNIKFDHNTNIIPDTPFFKNWDNLVFFLIELSKGSED